MGLWATAPVNGSSRKHCSYMTPDNMRNRIGQRRGGGGLDREMQGCDRPRRSRLRARRSPRTPPRGPDSPPARPDASNGYVRACHRRTRDGLLRLKCRGRSSRAEPAEPRPQTARCCWRWLLRLHGGLTPATRCAAPPRGPRLRSLTRPARARTPSRRRHEGEWRAPLDRPWRCAAPTVRACEGCPRAMDRSDVRSTTAPFQPAACAGAVRDRADGWPCGRGAGPWHRDGGRPDLDFAAVSGWRGAKGHRSAAGGRRAARHDRRGYRPVHAAAAADIHRPMGRPTGCRFSDRPCVDGDRVRGLVGGRTREWSAKDLVPP